MNADNTDQSVLSAFIGGHLYLPPSRFALDFLYQSDIIMMSEGENVHVAGERNQGAPRVAHGGAPTVDCPRPDGPHDDLVRQCREWLRHSGGHRGLRYRHGLPRWICGHQ